MSETFGDGRVNGFAPGDARPAVVSDAEAARLAQLVEIRRHESRVRRTFVGIGVLLAGLLVYDWTSVRSTERQAQDAIDRAVSACTKGSKLDFMRAKMEADYTFKKVRATVPELIGGQVGGLKSLELQSKLQNELRLRGCD